MSTFRRGARPLPLREGVDPVRIRLADPGQGPRSIVEELRRRFPERLAELDAALEAGLVVTADGTAVTSATRRHRGMDVWTYRTPDPEIPVPHRIEVLHRDERLVVVDKPHFLATTPRATHVAETALVRLRRDLGIDDLAPAHRLDRLTAGVLVFTVDPAHRGAYQELFAARRVDKTYLAVAPAPDGTPDVRERSSRIVKTRGILQAVEVDGDARVVPARAHDRPHPPIARPHERPRHPDRRRRPVPRGARGGTRRFLQTASAAGGVTFLHRPVFGAEAGVPHKADARRLDCRARIRVKTRAIPDRQRLRTTACLRATITL